MSTTPTPRQQAELERRKEVASAHEDRMASFRKSEEAARLRREEANPGSTTTSPATSDAIADIENVTPVRKVRTRK